MIKIQNLTKTFNHKTVINQISLEIKAGEFLVIFGHNGSGKTTLLKLIASILKPTLGKIIIDDQEAGINNNSVLSRISIHTDKSMLYSELTISENLLFFAKIFNIPDQQSRIKELIVKFDLISFQNEKIKNLSCGITNRAAIARTLLPDSDILLLDEPYSGLDQAGIRIIDDMLCSLKKSKKTVLMTSHELPNSYKIGSKYIILNQGQIAHKELTSSSTFLEFETKYLNLNSRQKGMYH